MAIAGAVTTSCDPAGSSYRGMNTFTTKTSNARENILSRIRKGLADDQLPMPYPDANKSSEPIYVRPDMDNEELFASAFIGLGGKFIFCDSEKDLLDNVNMLYENRGWNELLCADLRILRLFHNNKIDVVTAADPRAEKADACITGCELLIARTGSIMLSSQQNMGRVAPVYYPVHIVFAYANQIVFDIEDGLAAMKKKYGRDLPSMLNITTGASRTADIEKTLVVGVHGPAEVFCFLINADL